jgi:hypothetical protein
MTSCDFSAAVWLANATNVIADEDARELQVWRDSQPAEADVAFEPKGREKIPHRQAPLAETPHPKITVRRRPKM